MDLTENRTRIDKIDSQLIKLFQERMTVSADIAAYKKEHGLPVYDPRREREKQVAVAEQTPEELREYVTPLYSLLFDLSRSYQRRLIGGDSVLTEKIKAAIENTPKLFPEYASVACQGVEGANSQLACDRLFRNANIMFFSSFDAIFTAIEKGLCRYGIIPIENTTAGTVNTVYDLMMNHHFSIVRSLWLKIDHDLLAKPGARLSDIKEVYSHEQAINQCAGFLRKLAGVKVIPVENTAVAAKMVAESERKDIAAIASRQCTKYYDLASLAQSIQDESRNSTRFICISKDLEIYPGADRTSLMAVLPHEPGSLYKMLSILYSLGINLNKLESRPLPNRDSEFMFYFDLDASVYSPRFQQLISELSSTYEVFSYLGSYSEVR